MVTASKGVLVQCDVQTKVFIMNLNISRAAHEKVVIRELDDNNLLLNPKFVDLVKGELQKHNDSNTYQPAVVDKRI